MLEKKLEEQEIVALIKSRSKFDEEKSLEFTPCGNYIEILDQKIFKFCLGSSLVTIEDMISIFEVRVISCEFIYFKMLIT